VKLWLTPLGLPAASAADAWAAGCYEIAPNHGNPAIKTLTPPLLPWNGKTWTLPERGDTGLREELHVVGHKAA
jgi:hypothetical protein